MNEITPTPESAPAPATGTDIVKDMSRHLFMAKGWMKLLGVLSIIQGVLLVFSIWGIIFCWLPIWVGIVLHRAAGRVEMAYLNGDRDMLRDATANLQRFFTINGVLALIYVVIMGSVLLIALLAGGFGALASLADS